MGPEAAPGDRGRRRAMAAATEEPTFLISPIDGGRRRTKGDGEPHVCNLSPPNRIEYSIYLFIYFSTGARRLLPFPIDERHDQTPDRQKLSPPLSVSPGGNPPQKLSYILGVQSIVVCFTMYVLHFLR